MTPCDPPALLVINAGSSSLKFALYPADGDDIVAPIFSGELSGIAEQARLCWHDARSGQREDAALNAHEATSQQAALDCVLALLQTKTADHRILAVGHRVVHGGPEHAAPLLIDETTLAQLEKLIPLAPLHQPYNLAAIRAVMTRLPEALQVACFDTAFHRTCPDTAQRFALPRALHDEGIRRYGFHGLSYEYIAHTLGREQPSPRAIVAHLGAGASLCALRDGRSIATTMGFTALDGLVMGTRCGNLDPGVLLHLMSARGMNADALTHLLYHQSGLKGVSGISGDMRVLLADGSSAAEQAIDLFCYRAVREIGALAAALEGVDTLVFTAGIGENAPAIRERICAKLAWLGLELDLAENAKNSTLISRSDSAISVRVIPTDEQGMIARHTLRQLRATTPNS